MTALKVFVYFAACLVQLVPCPTDFVCSTKDLDRVTDSVSSQFNQPLACSAGCTLRLLTHDILTRLSLTHTNTLDLAQKLLGSSIEAARLDKTRWKKWHTHTYTYMSIQALHSKPCLQWH